MSRNCPLTRSVHRRAWTGRLVRRSVNRLLGTRGAAMTRGSRRRKRQSQPWEREDLKGYSTATILLIAGMGSLVVFFSFFKDVGTSWPGWARWLEVLCVLAALAAVIVAWGLFYSTHEERKSRVLPMRCPSCATS